jgi:hypothetical protein
MKRTVPDDEGDLNTQLSKTLSKEIGIDFEFANSIQAAFPLGCPIFYKVDKADITSRAFINWKVKESQWYPGRVRGISQRPSPENSIYVLEGEWILIVEHDVKNSPHLNTYTYPMVAIPLRNYQYHKSELLFKYNVEAIQQDLLIELCSCLPNMPTEIIQYMIDLNLIGPTLYNEKYIQ